MRMRGENRGREDVSEMEEEDEEMKTDDNQSITVYVYE